MSRHSSKVGRPPHTLGQCKQKFLASFEHGDGCWNWKGNIVGNGYGRICTPSQTSMRAHRYAFTHFVGPIPKGMSVLHKCDNRACVNPSHLFLGTHDDNMRDKVKKGRQIKGDQVPSNKLFPLDVITIKRLLALGKMQKDIAKLFGVVPATISKINRRIIWNYIP